ncbi:oleate hydratase [Actinospica sp. MGRD01-02]|uniref:Oleate hydratase n=1 Tax=Actinospica acidithermotolerans TaxID=2828514 RepID=A0A941E8V0_9ACTN|nr:oleate hydratase [Actinospica acidithermotolerans]MBR7825655.1 oleate hydratase [Actinospica acidithermotolerans]
MAEYTHTQRPEGSAAYLVGGGIAALAAAVFLIRDAGWDGSRITILEQSRVAGGSLDGSGGPGVDYVTRGGQKFEEEAYTCLWDLLRSIPTLDDPGRSVKDEIWAFNAKWHTDAGARLIGAGHEVLDASELGLDNHDRAAMAHLLALPEASIGSRRIDEFFSEHFFASNFWAMWRTTFAFQNWHSAIELKRYLLRFAQELPRLHTLAGVRRSRLNQYDSIVLPVESWLTGHGVAFEYGTRVTDVLFEQDGDGRSVSKILFERGGYPGSYAIEPDDLVFVTLGSMTSDSTFGDGEHAPGLVRGHEDGAFALWERIAAENPGAGFGNPGAFDRDVDASKWESFTIAMRDPLLLHRIEELSGNLPGTGGLMTFKDSPWLLSLAVPHAPHFARQEEGLYTAWGYGLLLDRPGEYVGKPMQEATGEEILIELLGQLGFDDDLEQILATASVVPVMMPYITSQFAPRAVTDRPEVIPAGARNFALLGQYVEMAEDVVFTVEYSVRAAMHAVYGLTGTDRKIPGIYHAALHPVVALRTLHSALA